jgi:small conductance mechanosensitive channel
MEKLNIIIDQLLGYGLSFGKSLLTAFVIYFVGIYIIKFANKLIKKALNKKKNIDPAVSSFVTSLVDVALKILLIIAVISALGIETTSFAALLASAGVAVGMALSGNLQNFAGGLMVLIFKPYRVGDYVEFGGIQGSVKEIKIFQTVLTTVDNKTIFVPNSAISSGTLTNYSTQPDRRVDWTFSVAYGTEYSVVKAKIEEIMLADARIKKDPALFIALGALADSSVNITVRAWVSVADYWDVFFDMNKAVYEEFNKAGIEFPFPQLQVHTSK